jgi:hypothetical protein
VRWRAFYSLNRDEYEPIAAAAADFPAAENSLVAMFAGPDTLLGDAQLSFDFSASADDKDELVAEAQRIFAQLRERAGLDPALWRLIGFAEVTRPPWEVALEKAHQASMHGQHEEVVVFAQTACETRATSALRSLLEHTGVPSNVVAKFIRSTSLRDDFSQSLLAALTDVRIQDADWWEKYERHVQRRNLVVHKGGDVPRRQADESLEVSRQFCDFIGKLV